MEFNNLCRKYFDELKNELRVANETQQATAELSFRSSLDNFLKNVALYINSDIDGILEPKNQSKQGRPDWRFHNKKNMGIYGFVEGKPLSDIAEIDIKPYRKQIDKYRSLKVSTILTDGAEFILFSPDGKIKKGQLFQKPIDWENPVINLDFEALIRQFFGEVGFREVSESELVNEVASHAKLLKKEINEIIELDDDEVESQDEMNTLDALRHIKSSMTIGYDSGVISNDSFSSFTAQLLSFVLLYSHRVLNHRRLPPEQMFLELHDFWLSSPENKSDKILPFDYLIRKLEKELDSKLSKIGLLYNNLRSVLSYIQLSGTQINSPDFHSLYESFLSTFDPKSRKDFGSFYTPYFLAEFTTELTNSLVEGIKGGEGVRYNKVLEPCCGTGTFIEAVSNSTFRDKVNEIIGLEIQPAPYALAQYRMALTGKSNIKIYLCNTLSDNISKSILRKSTSSWGFEKELEEASLSSNPPIDLIIGNPPASDSKKGIDAHSEYLDTLLEDFRPPREERKARQNVQKQIKNDFVKFLRWSIEKSNGPESVISLILPSSIIRHISFKYIRKYVVDNFSDAWVLEFDTDNRSKVEGDNLFQTLQGRCLLVLWKGKDSKFQCNLKYYSITHLKSEEKKSFLNKYMHDGIPWINIPRLDEHYRFRPISIVDKQYDDFIPIYSEKNDCIFNRHCSGVKLAPTHLLVHKSKGQLKRRSKFISNIDNNYESIIDKYYKGQAKPPAKAKITESIRYLLGVSITGGEIKSYSYRPYIKSNVVCSKNLLSELSNLGGGGTRIRPEIIKAFDGGNYGFSVSPAPADIGIDIHRFTSFCWNLPDNDLSARGNGRVFCLEFPEYKKGQLWDDTLVSNINENILNRLRETGIDSFEIERKLFFYTYAILCSNAYLSRYRNYLYEASGDFPKVPLPNKEQFSEFNDLSELGCKLASSEILNIDETSSNKFDLVNVEFDSFKVSGNDIILEMKNTDWRQVLDIGNIDIVDYEVSGYKIINQWLKLHSKPFFGKPLGKTESNEFNSLIFKIKETVGIIKDIDNCFNSLIEKLIISS
ncbi:type ISP restriction/modification enzyme [Vibrio splendidus]